MAVDTKKEGEGGTFASDPRTAFRWHALDAEFLPEPKSR